MSSLRKIKITDYAVLRSFLVKTNLSFNLTNLAKYLSDVIDDMPPNREFRSGAVIAVKYNDILKGEDLFKTKIGFKNACHLIMCHTLNKRRKKLIHIRITATGTFQVVGVPAVDVEKVVYKLFLILEKLNKHHKNDIFGYISTTKEKTRLEIVIVPILNNYTLTLDQKTIRKMFSNPKEQVIKKFKDDNFIVVVVPSDSAISIKISYTYKDYSNHPIKYIIWNKKGKSMRYIEYAAYTTLLSGAQEKTAKDIKYITIRLHSTGKVLIHGFDEILVQDSVDKFLSICEQF